MSDLSHLSLDNLFNVFRFLEWSDLQQVSQANRHLRSAVTDDPARQKLYLPTYYTPMCEIQKSSVKTIIINQSISEYDWLLTSIIRFKNVNNIEISRIDLPKHTMNWICRVAMALDRVRTVTVPEQLSETWSHICSSHHNFSSLVTTIILPEETLTATNSSSLINPLLKGVNATEIPAPVRPWLAAHANIISKFNTFRNNSIARLFNQPKLCSIEEALSLNGIILISNGNHTQYNFNVGEWEEICALARSATNPHHLQYSISNEDLSLINNITSQFRLNCQTKLSTLQQFTRELTTPYLNSNCSISVNNLCKMLLNYAEKITYNWNPVTMSEDSFTVNVFDPVFDAFLRGVEGLTSHGADHHLIESKLRRRKVASQFNEPIHTIPGRKPDRSLEWCLNQRQHHLCLVEIKTETTSKGRPDLVKLGTMMKDCLDNILDNGLNRQKCLIVGILLEGRTCTSYSLYSPSNFFYVMQEIDTCFMPSSYRDLDGLSNVVSSMSRCRFLVEKMVEVLDEYDVEDGGNENDVFAMQLTCASPKRHCQYYS